MVIAQISDTHLLDPTTHPDTWQARADDLARCVTAINKLEPQPGVVLHTGDIANTGSKYEYGLAREILSMLKAPLRITVGNRDNREAFRDAFSHEAYLASTTPFISYTECLGDVHLISVDSQHHASPRGHLCAERLSLLNTQLVMANDAPTILFMHHPPVAVQALKRPVQFETQYAMTAFTDLLLRRGNVVRILCGHSHRSDMLMMEEISVSSMPSVATDLRLDTYPERFQSIPVFQVHHYEESDGISTASHFAQPPCTDPDTLQTIASSPAIC